MQFECICSLKNDPRFFFAGSVDLMSSRLDCLLPVCCFTEGWRTPVRRKTGTALKLRCDDKWI